MYIYTDDDLTRINRDYLGPKHRRLPWVATYRTYGVSAAVVVGMFFVYMMLGVPLNQWTVLLFVFINALIVLYVVRRLRRDVSLLSMFRAGWQEVLVPRESTEPPEKYQVEATVQRFAYDAEPSPTRWQSLQQRVSGTRTPQKTTTPARRRKK